MNFTEHCIECIKEEVKEAAKAKKAEDRLEGVHVILDYRHEGFIFFEVDDYNMQVDYDKMIFFSEKEARKLFMRCFYSNKRFVDACRFIAKHKGRIF